MVLTQRVERSELDLTQRAGRSGSDAGRVRGKKESAGPQGRAARREERAAASTAGAR